MSGLYGVMNVNVECKSNNYVMQSQLSRQTFDATARLLSDLNWRHWQRHHEQNTKSVAAADHLLHGRCHIQEPIIHRVTGLHLYYSHSVLSASHFDDHRPKF